MVQRPPRSPSPCPWCRPPREAGSPGRRRRHPSRRPRRCRPGSHSCADPPPRSRSPCPWCRPRTGRRRLADGVAPQQTTAPVPAWIAQLWSHARCDRRGRARGAIYRRGRRRLAVGVLSPADDCAGARLDRAAVGHRPLRSRSPWRCWVGRTAAIRPPARKPEREALPGGPGTGPRPGAEQRRPAWQILRDGCLSPCWPASVAGAFPVPPVTDRTSAYHPAAGRT